MGALAKADHDDSFSPAVALMAVVAHPVTAASGLMGPQSHRAWRRLLE